MTLNSFPEKEEFQILSIGLPEGPMTRAQLSGLIEEELSKLEGYDLYLAAPPELQAAEGGLFINFVAFKPVAQPAAKPKATRRKTDTKKAAPKSRTAKKSNRPG